MLIILPLVLVASVFFFFYRMYQNEMKALTRFISSYEKFDKTIADLPPKKN